MMRKSLDWKATPIWDDEGERDAPFVCRWLRTYEGIENWPWKEAVVMGERWKISLSGGGLVVRFSPQGRVQSEKELQTRLPIAFGTAQARFRVLDGPRVWSVAFDGMVARLLDSDGGTVAEIRDSWKDSETGLGIRHHLRYSPESPHPVLAFFVGLKINCLPGPSA